MSNHPTFVRSYKYNDSCITLAEKKKPIPLGIGFYEIEFTIIPTNILYSQVLRNGQKIF